LGKGKTGGEEGLLFYFRRRSDPPKRLLGRREVLGLSVGWPKEPPPGLMSEKGLNLLEGEVSCISLTPRQQRVVRTKKKGEDPSRTPLLFVIVGEKGDTGVGSLSPGTEIGGGKSLYT